MPITETSPENYSSVVGCVACGKSHKLYTITTPTCTSEEFLIAVLASFKWQEVCGFEYKSESIKTNYPRVQASRVK